jgi:hypothetical protein
MRRNIWILYRWVRINRYSGNNNNSSICCHHDSSFGYEHLLLLHLSKKNGLDATSSSNRKHLSSTNAATNCLLCKSKYSDWQSTFDPRSTSTYLSTDLKRSIQKWFRMHMPLFQFERRTYCVNTSFLCDL